MEKLLKRFVCSIQKVFSHLNPLKKRIFRFVKICIIVYGLFCTFIFCIQKSLLFFPIHENISIPKNPRLSEVSLLSDDNSMLNGWFLDNKSATTILFFHGNGGNIAYNEERLQIFEELHCNALIVDYRGYGKSTGTIEKEEDLYMDGDTAYQYLIRKGIDPKNIIVWWQSLGSAIAIHLVQNKSVRAVIVESAFISMDTMASQKYWFLPAKLLLQFHFRNDEKIGNIISPLFVIHSRDDEMIAFSQGKRLFDIASTRKTFLETNGSHNGGFQTSYPLYISFLKNILENKY